MVFRLSRFLSGKVKKISAILSTLFVILLAVSCTSKNRELLTKLSVPKNYVGTDGWGNQWYSKILKDGRQAWSESRNGIIWDGGINSSPLPWDPNTGYKRP